MKIIPVLCFLAVACVAATVQAGSSYHVLAVHSYSQEYTWTSLQHRAFVSEFKEGSGLAVVFSTEYLDTKRRLYSPEYAATFSRFLAEKYQHYSPDIIYVTDDDGYLFARDYLSKLYPDVPVFFSGVNDYGIFYELSELNIRGVFEKKDISKNLDLIVDIGKDKDGIIVLGDGSNTYAAIESEIKSQLIKYPELKTTFIVHENLEYLLADLKNRPQEYIFLTTIGSIKSVDGSLVNPETVVSEITNANSFNLFTMEDAYFYEGVIGGYVASGKQQGSAAARLALSYQAGEPVSSIDNIVLSPNIYLFDQTLLDKLHIQLPDKVKQVAELHNIPASFYERNRLLILTSLIMVSSTLLILVVTLFYLRIKSRIDKLKAEAKHAAQVERYQNAILSWSEINHQDIDEAFKKATAIAAETLKVSRVSIWLYNDTKTALECKAQYVAGEGYSRGMLLFRKHLPTYFAAVDTGKRLVIDNARTNPDTQELLASYLPDNDIYSMLDVPIFYDGTISGVMCHEHTGSYRQWTANEQEFCSLIASDMSLVLEVGKRRIIEKNLEHQAYHDPLTGLPNRTLLIDRMGQAIKVAKREKSLLAVLILDLDHFKQINDSFGHFVGDEVLVAVSGKLKSCLREMDTIARLGGDEFAVLISSFSRLQEVSDIAGKLFTLIQEPIKLQSSEFSVTPSIGISVYPDDGTTIDILLRNADAAMYRAKEKGRNTFEFYTEDMTVRALEKVNIISGLKRAIENDDFEVYYQPQYDIRNGNIVGLEALVRWHHPELGFMLPGKFLPAVEDSGLIVALDRWVMRASLKQWQIWQDQGVKFGRLSLNLTMRQIDQADFIDFLSDLIEEFNCDPKTIGFEVTEGQLMENAERTVAVLTEISELGINISVDDFGTGYSSLSYLKRLPVDLLKIDRVFIQDVPGDADGESIVCAVIALAKKMNIAVLAEGVESRQQLDFLKNEGCYHAQGFYLAHPQPAAKIPELAHLPLLSVS